MKWRRLGKLFDPGDFRLSNDCSQFAQSPQALVFDEHVRFYFSTRSLEASSGKYLSHVAFVDVKKDLREVLRVSNHTVLPLGKLGCFDEHGIFPMNVLRVGEVIHAYTCGWSRRVSVSVETAIGLALSHDGGTTFQRAGDGPILAASLHEPCLIGDAFVQCFDGAFHMWYIFGTGWKRPSATAAPERVYKIGHAVSSNGAEWIKDEGRQLIADCLGPDECQALPSVIRISGLYHMFFCYRQCFDFRANPDRGYRIGHAVSGDLVHWSRDDSEPSLSVPSGCWDSEMQCYPHAFECDGRVYLAYNGNDFGRHGFGLAVLE